MNKMDIAVGNCLRTMKESADFSDAKTTTAFRELLSEIISCPSQLVNYPNEEKLSLVLSSIFTSSFPSRYPLCEGMNVRDVIFVCGYYLYMHQLETGYFYDRNWPAFILLIHLGQSEFVKFIIEMNPFAPEKVRKLMGKSIDPDRGVNIAKGVELNFLLVAKKTGFLIPDIEPWFDELYDEYDELLSDKDPFRRAAIPLYECISNYLKENDITFVNVKE